MLISIAWCWKLCDTIKSWKFSSRVTIVQWLRCSIYRYAYSSNNTEILPVFIERKNARWYYQQSKAVRRWFKGFTKVTTFYLWPHRFHAGRQVSSVLFKENYYLESLCKVHSLQRLSQNTRSTFISDQNKLFKTGYQFNPDASLLHCKVGKHFLIISSLTQMKT